MCEERERLIGYVYDECDPAERHTIEAHLETCPTCRREIGGLRNVRQDLLAWSVPEHEPIWRPMSAAPRVESPWRVLPTWAMAAAAGLMLMVGAAGGAATYAFLPRANAQAARVSAPPETAMTAETATTRDAATIAALERRLAKLEQTAVIETPRSQAVSAAPVDIDAIRARTDELARRVNWLNVQQDDLTNAVFGTYSVVSETRAKQLALERKTNNWIQASLPAGEVPQGFAGAR